MPVDLQSYRPWDGAARPTFSVVGSIASTMVRRIYRLKLVRWVVTVVLFMSLAVPGVLYAFMLQGQGNRMFRRLVQSIGLDQVDLLAFGNRNFLSGIGFWCTLVAALVASPLIAEDRRVGALALYFSRPISHVHYVLGKMLALAFFVGALLLLPPILMFVMDLAMAEGDPRYMTFLKSLVPTTAALVAVCSVSLGISSLHRRTNYAALMTLGLFVGVNVMANALARGILRDADWLALYPFACVERIAIELLPVADQLNTADPMIRQIDLTWAWSSLAIWTLAGLGVLVARVRNVEVVG